MSKKDQKNYDSDGTVPVPDAMKMTENWKTYLAESKQEFNVESYYVPISSFQDLLKTNPTAEAVKVCIGLADPNNPATSQILLIPIVDGKIKPYIGPDKHGGVGDDFTDSNIYDLSQPEPPYRTTPPHGK
ncbi:MAG: hypothetical protein V4560_11560 [Bacteroidota bacterium]